MSNELVARAIDFLERHGEASSAELARHVFGGESFAPLLSQLSHERIEARDGRWRLREAAHDVALLEILTSGPNPRRHRIVELAAERSGSRFRALIRSARPVPALLRKLGVPDQPAGGDPSTADAEDGWLSPATAAEQLRGFVAGAIVVGFSYQPSFLEQILGPGWPAIDLLRLVDRLAYFRGRPDPERLAKHFELPVPAGRRPSAMLTFSASLFERLRGELSVPELLEVGKPVAQASPTRPALPETPGVYVMATADGDPLYVGKSVNVSRRVKSYLRTPIAEQRNLYQLMSRTSHIDVIPVSSEVEALLLEARLIDAWQPQFNVQRHSRRRPHYLRLSADAFPRLTLALEPAPDGATYFGPFRHTTAAARLRSLLTRMLLLRTCTRILPPAGKPRPACEKAAGQCLAPCIPGPTPSPYSTEVDHVRRLLSASQEDFRSLLLELLRERPPTDLAAARTLRTLLERLHAPAGDRLPAAANELS